MDVETVVAQMTETEGQLAKIRSAMAAASNADDKTENVEQSAEFRGAHDELRETKSKYASSANELGALEWEIEDSKDFILNLERRLRQAASRQESRRIEAEALVNKYAVTFLRNDLPRQKEFQVAQEVTVDFERNLSMVDKQVSFSASSITYLKASVHFAIFFAALELPFFRYPKFIANDNIADKDMEVGRIQNFQKLIVKQSQASRVRHQIIFTTSHIAPEFDNTPLCVGPSYTFENKTLKFPVAAK